MRIVTYCLFVSLQLYATCPRVLMMDDPLPEITINAAELSDVISFVAISSRCLGTKIKLSADECAQKFIYTITIIDDKQSVFHELPKTGIRVTIKQDAGKTLHDFCLTLAKLYDLQYVRSNTNLTFVACRPSDDNNTTKGYFHYPIGNHSPFLIHDSNETRTFPRYSASNLNKYMSFIATDQIVICDDDGNMTSSGTFTYTWNGNVAEYVAAADGSVAAHYGYTPFGGIAAQSGALVDTFTHRFSTKPWCGVTGLYEYQFRKYSPSLGRWMKYDDLEEIGGVNLYSFIDNFRNGTGLDFMGLLADGDCCKNCETLKKLWEEKQGLESIGNMIIVNEWWDYLKNRFEKLYAKVGYEVTITCAKDLICGKAYTLMPKLSFVERKKRCNIRIGCDPNSDHKQCSLSVQTDVFVHELTHCDQMYLIDPSKSCREQLCLEIRGYFRERRNKEIFRDDPRNGIAYAWTSVYDLPLCKGMRLEDVSPRTVPEKRAFIKKCARVPWKGQQW